MPAVMRCGTTIIFMWNCVWNEEIYLRLIDLRLQSKLFKIADYMI